MSNASKGMAVAGSIVMMAVATAGVVYRGKISKAAKRLNKFVHKVPKLIKVSLNR